jgi:hypothetical protein
LLEVQHRLRQLSYFDLFGRSRLSIELTRIALTLPIALDRAMSEQQEDYGSEYNQYILPKRLAALIIALDGMLGRVEAVLGP